MNTLLETLISMLFIYLMLSLLVSFVTEAMQKWLKRRGKMLKTSIDRILNDDFNKNFSEILYDHPTIWGLRRDEKHLPSYISAPTFASTLIDIIRREGIQPRVYKTTDGKTLVEEIPPGEPYADFIKGLRTLSNSDLKMRLEQMVNQCMTMDHLKENLERWYSEYQETVGSDFRTRAKKLAFFSGLIITILVNVDSIGLFSQLQSDDQLRSSMVVAADQWSTKSSTS